MKQDLTLQKLRPQRKERHTFYPFPRYFQVLRATHCSWQSSSSLFESSGRVNICKNKQQTMGNGFQLQSEDQIVGRVLPYESYGNPEHLLKQKSNTYILVKCLGLFISVPRERVIKPLFSENKHMPTDINGTNIFPYVN